MTLTHEQRQELQLGDCRIVDPVTNEAYVLVSEAVFERVKNLLYDDGPLTEPERRQLLIEAGRRAGWDDPEMDIYNDLDPRRTP